MINLSKRKSDLMRIIEVLPERETYALEMFIKFLITQINDPVLATLLTAPIDEIPLSKEEIEVSERSWQEYLEGKSKPLARVIKDQLLDRDD